jgi:hypothetical protein
LVSQQTRTSPPDEKPRWQHIVDGIEAKRREMKPQAEKLDVVVRTVLLNLQSALTLPGAIEPASIADVCNPLDGLPQSHIDYMNNRRNYDYWNNAAVWSISDGLPGVLYSATGMANSSFTITRYVSIAMVMLDIEQPYMNIHVYPQARLSSANRPRLAEIVQRETGLPVLKCTHGDGCV